MRTAAGEYEGVDTFASAVIAISHEGGSCRSPRPQPFTFTPGSKLVVASVAMLVAAVVPKPARAKNSPTVKYEARVYERSYRDALQLIRVIASSRHRDDITPGNDPAGLDRLG